MRINFKKIIFWLLGISFSSAAISDLIYGKSELAREYLIGQFINQIFSVSVSFASVLCLLYFIFQFLLKDFFEAMLYNRYL